MNLKSVLIKALGGYTEVPQQSLVDIIKETDPEEVRSAFRSVYPSLHIHRNPPKKPKEVHLSRVSENGDVC